MIKNIFARKITILLVILLLSMLVVGCTTNNNHNYSDMILVVYDGNGGYLRNKTDVERKILVEPNSKIPRYSDELLDDPYSTSSLGLATRSGYNLMGWYLAENATYTIDPLGTFVYLDEAQGHGVYTLDPEGDYILGYVENVAGKVVFIQVEEPAEGVDPTTIEYIYFYGNNGYGFYIYDSDNADHAEVYNTEKNIYDEERSSYRASELTKFGSFYLYSDLTADEKTLFADLLRYNREYYLRDANDQSLDRYSFGSGYTSVDSMLELDPNGDYVIVSNNIEVYDDADPAHADLDRYSIAIKYKFIPTLAIPTPSYMTKYKANITYWDFEVDRVTEPIVLIAHWTKKCTVSFIQKSGQITNFTTKFNPEKTRQIDLVEGDTIGKPETIPQYPGYTFIGWSKSEDTYQPWDFNTDIFPVGEIQLNLYGYMIQGVYTRLTTADSLATVANNLDGDYVLCNDIDLGGQVFLNRSPLGMTTQNAPSAVITPFTGSFVSLGFTISNFTLRVTNTQKSLPGGGGIYKNSITGLFPYVQDAHIEGINLEDVSIIIVNDAPKATDIVYDLGGAGLIGTALDGTTTVEDCSVDVTIIKTSAYVLDCTVYVGDIVALGKANVTFVTTTATLDYTAISGITTGSLSVETLN